MMRAQAGEENEMKVFRYPFVRLGIIGGGQLGKMMTQEAKRMGFWVTVLDPTPSSPAGQLADEEIVASFFHEESLQSLVAKSEVVTYDIEHVNTEFLQKLPEKDKVYPAPETLAIIQDKWQQKATLRQNNIPLPRFALREEEDLWSSFGFPLVEKARYGGYDGRGVVILERGDRPGNLSDSSFFEEYVPVEKELAVLVARSREGHMAFYPVIEMVFHGKTNICDMAFVPAQIPEDKAQEAQSIARRCVEVLQGVGIFAVEMFLAEDGRLLVNEIAPRPHNSGHLTIEACMTSQFEQHLRAICGFPLGSTELLSPAVMVNLLGMEGYQGPSCVEGLQEVLSLSGVTFHFYGKRETRPFRKMGHVTIRAATLEEALARAQEVKEILAVKA